MRNRIRKLLQEVRIVNVIPRRGETINTADRYFNEKPFKKGETIRVYHGMNDMNDVINTVMYGISGKDRANRRYSYESVNNPTGLFISLDLQTVKEFSGSFGAILEFHAKYEDLEAPVWAGKESYFIQGEYTQQFRNEKERKQAQQAAREKAKKHEDERVSKSDNPEVANWLFGAEYQALFTGDLNPNSIRAIWYKEGDRNINSTYKRYTRKEFIDKIAKPKLANIKEKRKEKGSWGYSEKADKGEDKIFLPREDWNKEEFIRRLINKNTSNDEENIEYIKKMVNEWISDKRQNEYIYQYLYPRQLDQLFGKNKWRAYKGGWYDDEDSEEDEG
jgi:hypothetical protein